MKIFLILFCFLIFPRAEVFFGIETISVYMNKKEVGFWNSYTKKPETVVANFRNNSDILFIKGYSDVGYLDGTIIKIKYNDSLVFKLTRLSESGILKHDSVMINPKPGEKQSFFLDRNVTFKITKQDLEKLPKNRIYHLFIQSLIVRNIAETHIFDLQLK